jgi:hypothetical protein
MRIPPVTVLLTWPTSDSTNPITHGQALLITNVVAITLVCIAVTGRLYSRIVIKQWFGVDDTMCVLAWLFTCGM